LKERHYGIDLLRVMSMIYIIMLHVLGRGGVLKNLDIGTNHLYAAWFLEVLAYCAVDCFALISGYVGYKEGRNDLNLSRYMNMWLMVVFYGVVMTAIYSVIMPGAVTLADYGKAITPVYHNAYWYLTAYTGLFFVMPIINSAVNHLSNDDAKRYAVICLAVFSLYASLCSVEHDIFTLKRGYSFIWLSILYFVGAIMKKTGWLSQISRLKGTMIILVMVILTEFCRMNHYINSVPLFKHIVSYHSPTIVLIAIMHLVLFSKLSISQNVKGVIKFMAPGSFAGYIINNHPYIWRYLMKGNFAYLATSPLYMLPLVTIGFSVLFVLGATFIDHFRQKLFKMIKVDYVTNYLGTKIEHIIDQLVSVT